MLAAASGRKRTESVADLAELRMGVRADRPGVLLGDYHTASNVIRADASGHQDTALSERKYLSDAAFLVGLEGHDLDFLLGLHQHLSNPHWPLALGRRAFPPTMPVQLTLDDGEPAVLNQSLEQSLIGFPPIAKTDASVPVRYFIEHEQGEQDWYDQPLDDFRKRSFGLRRVKVVSAEWGHAWF